MTFLQYIFNLFIVCFLYLLPFKMSLTYSSSASCIYLFIGLTSLPTPWDHQSISAICPLLIPLCRVYFYLVLATPDLDFLCRPSSLPVSSRSYLFGSNSSFSHIFLNVPLLDFLLVSPVSFLSYFLSSFRCLLLDLVFRAVPFVFYLSSCSSSFFPLLMSSLRPVVPCRSRFCLYSSRLLFLLFLFLFLPFYFFLVAPCSM